jgi:hypothetical protein
MVMTYPGPSYSHAGDIPITTILHCGFVSQYAVDTVPKKSARCPYENCQLGVSTRGQLHYILHFSRSIAASPWVLDSVPVAERRSGDSGGARGNWISCSFRLIPGLVNIQKAIENGHL